MDLKEERAQFISTGIISFRRLVPKGDTDRAKDYIFSELLRLGLRVGGKWHTKKLDGVPPFQVSSKIAQGIRNHPHLDAVIPKSLLAYLNALADRRLRGGTALPHRFGTWQKVSPAGQGKPSFEFSRTLPGAGACGYFLRP